MTTPVGTKRTVGFVIMALPALLQVLCYTTGACYTLSEAAPVEMALLTDPIAQIVGAAVLIYGTVKAKGPHWIAPKSSK